MDIVSIVVHNHLLSRSRVSVDVIGIIFDPHGEWFQQRETTRITTAQIAV